VDEQALFSCAKLVFLLELNFEQAQFNPNKNPTANAAGLVFRVISFGLES
jgi:hypothetical protein